ncbi:MAG TPA: hypothetical protein VNE71_03270, partial [Myxococcota bacterium]|nr:hypothetical protein [Myxococcota bacterium]
MSRPGAALAALAAALLGCAPDPALLEAKGGAVLTRVWLHHSAAATAPPPSDPGWRPAALPDYWGIWRRSRGLAGWYRVEFARSPGPDPWALSVIGDWEALAVELDGRPLVRADALRPTLGDPRAGIVVPLPESAATAGTHELALRFETAAWRIGYLESIAIGPTHVVFARHDRLALQPTLRTALAALAAACGVLLALLARWDETRAAPWLAAGTLVWSASFLMPWPWLTAAASGLAIALCVHVFPVPLAIGLHRKLEIVDPRRERTLFAVALAPAAVRMLVPPLYVPLVDGLWWLVVVGIGFYVLRLAILVARRGSVERSGVLLVGTMLALAAGLHDLASLAIGRAPIGIFLFQFAPGILALSTVAMLVASLGTRLGLAERLNVELEDRVEARRRELAASYVRMAELERDHAITAERERLMRDMHDGTGGALVSAIAMAEASGAGSGAIAEVLRDALADLRLSIDSLDP